MRDEEFSEILCMQNEINELLYVLKEYYGYSLEETKNLTYLLPLIEHIYDIHNKALKKLDLALLE